MTLSRRDFASLVAGGLAGLTLPGPAGARLLDRLGAGAASVPAALPGQATFFQWIRVSDAVRVAVGGGGNTLLYRGGRGALQSDGKNFGLGRTLRREAEAHGVPVTHFVNTHHHGDHSGGNDGFRDVTRLAHDNARPRILASAEASLAQARERLTGMSEQLEGPAAGAVRADLEGMLAELDRLTPEDFAPETTFSDELELMVDGLPVECRWVSRGHTDGDNFLYLPQANVLHCGDLFFHGRHPYVDETAGATPAGWVRCLDAMLSLCDADTVVIPGHGEITDRNGLAGQREYFQELERMVSAAMADGRTRDEVVALAPPELTALPGAERHLPRNLGFVYDELAG